MATYEVFTSVQSSQSSSQSPKALWESCMLLHIGKPTHTHTKCQQSKQRECPQLQRACIGFQAYRQTQWPSIQIVNTLLFVLRLMSASLQAPPTLNIMSVWRVYPILWFFLVPVGVPSFRDHSRNSDPGLRARAKERQRRPDGRTHQDPHFLGLWHEGTGQKVRQPISFRECSKFLEDCFTCSVMNLGPKIIQFSLHFTETQTC